MRKAVGVLLILVILACAAWSGLWFYAAHEAEARTDAWIAAEQAQGRAWACPHRAVGGFPFALAVTCDHATYAGQGMGQRVDALVTGLEARVALNDPRRIIVTLRPPFNFRTSDGATSVEGTWHSLVLDLAPASRTVDMQGSGVALAGLFAGSARTGGTADTIATRFALVEDRTNPTVGFDLAVKGAAVPPLDDLLGGSVPADLVVAGRLDRAEVGVARTPEEAMERWRQAGGRIAIDRSMATRAGASVAATGALGLDESHRLKGRLDAEFRGLEPILARYGIRGNLAVVSSLVSALFGGGRPHQAPAAPGALDLPISFNNGRLGIGPITTPVRLTPLY